MHSLNVGDTIIEGTDNLLAHATDFYKNLFGPAPGNLFKMEQDSWGVEEKLSEEDNNILEQPV